jgi:plastocyanin
MNHHRYYGRLLLGPLTLGLLLLVGIEIDAGLRAQGQPEQTVEIVIRDSAFSQSQITRMQMDAPTVIILRNQDKTRHGFTSEMFKGLLVNGEGDGVIAYGKGVEGFYVDPGKTLTLRFTLAKPGSYAFRCDLHPAMKGELYLLELRTA